jgi:hypothetical protein
MPLCTIQRVEDRHGLLHVGGGATHHQAVAVVQAPDAAGDTTVEVADALGLEQLLVLEVLGELAVATVDDEVALVEQLGELGDGVPGRCTVRHHHPDHARSVELVHHVREGRRVGDRLVAVVPDDLVAGAADPLAHVATHLAQTDQTQLHVVTPRGGGDACPAVGCDGRRVVGRGQGCRDLSWRTAPA